MNIEPHLIKGTKVEQHQEQNQKQEYKFIGSVTIKPGCKLFAYNPDNDEMKEVIAVGGAVADMQGNVVINKKAQHDYRMIYFQAINQRNAMRKLAKYQAGEYLVAETFEKKNPLFKL